MQQVHSCVNKEDSFCCISYGTHMISLVNHSMPKNCMHPLLKKVPKILAKESAKKLGFELFDRY